MNIIISAFVGGLIATATMVGGVQALNSSDPKPVSSTSVVTYTDQ